MKIFYNELTLTNQFIVFSKDNYKMYRIEKGESNGKTRNNPSQ